MQLPVFHISKLGLLGLRGISVLAKFLFTVLYFKFSEEAFGTYSLVATTIFLLVFLLGLDFYSYANRAVLENKAHIQKIIINQFTLYFALYLLLLPLIYFVFWFEKFDFQYFWIFYIVLITEHINMEFYRLFFVFKKPWEANISFFLRNGLWVLIAVFLLFRQHQIELSTILWLWLLGNILALLFTLIQVNFKKNQLKTTDLKPDLIWIKNGIFISFPYILSTLSYKTIEFADRYIIDFFMDKKAVGVYAFFTSMANVMNIVIFTVVISVLYPGLVESLMQKNKDKFKKIYRQFKKEIIVYGAGMSVFLTLFLPFLLISINKKQYMQDFFVFILLVVANLVLNFSFLHHFVMYAFKKDWQIFKATGIAALLNIVFNIFFIPIWGITGAAFATFVSIGIIYLMKYKDAALLKKTL